MTIDKRALREVAEKATKGEWWSDVVDTDGEYGEGEDRVSGYHSYAVYVGHESLLDMINSTAACIHTEWDHDYHMAWDETAKRNAEFIAAANPATVLALLDELEADKEQIKTLESRNRRLQGIIDVAEKRIAEQSSQKRLIGWRASDYTDETSDPELAKNWAAAIGVLPIFEGDVNTKLSAAGIGKGE
ncbi:ead/Ea22-like family protein [Salmonella enterica]|nr:ead/Ea22-like family protein [Salmonella enterica]EBR8637500.1 ead/Ea22-like family protein [Salmonella enterica subsp. enterica serovar Bareilly]EBV4083585.1 ead/Ea22-like family protein [Salmonella enterica subsp. enterica serovar Bareilly]ECB1994305.1 ead/Ea22-like family protein [Salmonella enterica subsp. enterica serovar Bareilly]ECC3353134.1 ead/Ea22-like family protein [Salmonella enterica subsp. enterica serovar Bareilly]